LETIETSFPRPAKGVRAPDVQLKTKVTQCSTIPARAANKKKPVTPENHAISSQNQSYLGAPVVAAGGHLPRAPSVLLRIRDTARDTQQDDRARELFPQLVRSMAHPVAAGTGARFAFVAVAVPTTEGASFEIDKRI
jgi:hypothetical protein